MSVCVSRLVVQNAGVRPSAGSPDTFWVVIKRTDGSVTKSHIHVSSLFYKILDDLNP